MTKRKLLLIADDFYPKQLPPESQVNTLLAAALDQNGWDVAVWSGLGARVPPSCPNVNIVRNARHWGISEVAKLLVWVLKERPKKIIIMYFAASYSLKQHINWVPLFAKLLDIECVTLFTNQEKPQSGILQKAILRISRCKDLYRYPIGLFSFSDRLVFHSEGHRRKLLGSDPCGLTARSVVAPPPVLLPVPETGENGSTRELLGVSEGCVLVCFFGLIYPGKGIEWLLSAVALLKDRGEPIKVAFIGSNGGITGHARWNAKCRKYERKLRQQVQKLGIEKNVIWTGFTPNNDLTQLLTQCDLACLPFDDGVKAHRSSFAACAISGLPVVTTVTEDTDEFLCKAGCGITLIAPKSPIGLADAISRLSSCKEIRRQEAAEIANFAKLHFSSRPFFEAFEWSAP